jgi:hypothetical protein
VLVRGTPEVAADAAPSAPPAATTPPPTLSAADVRAAVEPLIRDQAGELRRSVVAAIDGAQAKAAADVAQQIEAATAELVQRLTPPPPLPPPPPPRPWGLIAALNVAVIAAAILGVWEWRSLGEIAALRATIDRQTAALTAATPAEAPPVAEPWPAERHALTYGDAPFTPARIAQIGNWLAVLEQRGFVGSARIVVSLADYCLAGNPGDGFSPAPAEMPSSGCDLRGSPPDELRSSADKEPAALAALLNGITERTHGEIDAKVIYTKATGYPSAGASAAQWNAAANKGHYVEFIAQPRTR